MHGTVVQPWNHNKWSHEEFLWRTECWCTKLLFLCLTVWLTSGFEWNMNFRSSWLLFFYIIAVSERCSFHWGEFLNIYMFCCAKKHEDKTSNVYMRITSENFLHLILSWSYKANSPSHICLLRSKSLDIQWDLLLRKQVNLRDVCTSE